jgi:hypothetical protein
MPGCRITRIGRRALAPRKSAAAVRKADGYRSPQSGPTAVNVENPNTFLSLIAADYFALRVTTAPMTKAPMHNKATEAGSGTI